MLEQIVTSKYFQKSGMDNSLTDFQEKKNICTGPKSNKVKPKKQISKKQIKGQKDIRTLIKPKKNELLTFTKDFNTVCAQGGVDVDSQQLQLAIALSKSLQQSDQTEPEIPTNNLSSQERTNRIRRTLQEYGFRVPQVKIKLEGSKRVKRCRKTYKLLQISEEERHQKISNRYSQVLFENPDKSFEKETKDCNTVSNLYNLATSITYEDIRTNEVFITGILQEISITKGDLLRDWSEIPGRPISPKLVENYVISMPDIKCSQNELDIILSGTLNMAKDILKTKLNALDNKVKETNIPDIICVENNKSIADKGLELKSGQENLSIMVNEQNRSHSPDIFDDDPSVINNSINENQNIEMKSSKSESSNITLDIQGTDVTSNVDTCSQSNSSSISNITKRKSNDFMDITECVSVTSQNKKILKTINEVELAHNSMEFTKCVNPLSQEIDNKDQTKAFIIEECILLEDEKMNDKLPAVSEEKKLNCSSNDIITIKDDCINLTQYNTKVLEDTLEDNIETMDLTQSSNSNDLPEIDLPGTQKNSLDDTIIVQYIPQTNINNKTTTSNEHQNNDIKEANDIVLNISDDSLPETNDVEQNRSTIIHNSQHRTVDKDFSSQIFDSENIATNKENNDIDLTQSSDSTIGYESPKSVSENIQINYNSLGKKDDVSIDYDEVFDEVVENVYSIDEQNKENRSKSTNNSSTYSNNDVVLSRNASQNFELCDRELNYSMYRSRVDDNLEDISIVNDDNETPNINKSYNGRYNNYTINRSLSESDLPIININDNKTNNRDKQFNITLSKSTCSTPIKATVTDDRISIKTPTNSEYVVKLGEVTPMLDYEAMSSPERNKELEKYGLKPFKRKRAIQLLTHLYNQTHPVIEQCSEDPVPIKKLKPNTPEKRTTKENNIVLDKQNIYIETKTIPDIKDIECCPDDWVFQKREKAKVHSCPVPLHIVFHNYISCRRYLREAILRYEPINIDVIHKDLVSYGFKYNPKDLLKFMDRKCITVKTADNNARNK